MSEEYCPFCGAPLQPNTTSEHMKTCPVLRTKRQIAVAPGRVGSNGPPLSEGRADPYEEGELPPHLKEILRRKGSFLTDEVAFVG